MTMIFHLQSNSTLVWYTGVMTHPKDNPRFYHGGSATPARVPDTVLSDIRSLNSSPFLVASAPQSVPAWLDLAWSEFLASPAYARIQESMRLNAEHQEAPPATL